MAWTDASRTTLIEEFKQKPVLWDKSAQSDPNTRLLKHEAVSLIVDTLNTAFFPHDSRQQYTVDEVRAQWKNLKDTYVRKQRWLTAGKYSRDPAEEPTWKFFRLLKFLDKNEDLKDEGNTNSNDGEEKRTNGSTDHDELSSQTPEEHALSLLFKNEVDTVTETIVARPARSQSPQRTPSPAQPSTSEPPRKRGRPPSSTLHAIHTSPLPNTHTFPTNSFPVGQGSQDEFHHFGSLVAATLRRVSAEANRVEALKLQKKLTDVLFEAQITLLQREIP